MANIPFVKMETIGNDFVVVHFDAVEGLDLAELAQDLCERRFSVGSDGLLVLGPSTDPSYEVEMRMFNPDGTEDFCGNGLRCAAVHAVEAGWASGSFRIRQYGIVVPVSVDVTGVATAVLPPASFLGSDIPSLVEGEVEAAGVLGTPVTTGSAHFVVMVEDLPEDEAFFALSPQIENDERFPERISVIWTKSLDDHTLALRIWERGVGETMGCGTGSSAAAIVWARHSGRFGSFEVRNPGGALQVTVESVSSSIASSSRPVNVFTGSFEVS